MKKKKKYNFLIVPILCFIFSLDIAIASDLDDIERNFIKVLNKKCDEVDITPLSFPDASYSLDNLAACEFSSKFNPDKYKIKYSHLAFANGSFNSVNSSDYAQANYTLDNYYDVSVNDTLFDKILKGDVRTFSNFRDEHYNYQNKLELNEINKLSEIYDEKLMHLSYSSDSIFSDRYSMDDFEVLTRYLLNTSKDLSNSNLNYAVEELNRKLFVYALSLDQSSTFMTVALMISPELRRMLLSLDAISSTLHRTFINMVRLIEYHDDEIWSDFLLGTDRKLYELITNDPEYIEAHIYKCFAGLEASLSGIISLNSPRNDISCLQDHQKFSPNKYSKIKKYITTNLDDLITDDFKTELDEILNNLNNISTNQIPRKNVNILKAQLRYLLTLYPEHQSEFQKNIIDNLSRKWINFAFNFKSDVLKISIFQNVLNKNSNFRDELELREELKKAIKTTKSFETLCGNLSYEQCIKIIRSIDLNVYTLDLFVLEEKYDVTEIDTILNLQNSKTEIEAITCRFSNLGNIWFNIKFKAHGFIPEIATYCSYGSLKNSLESPELTLGEIILKSSAFPFGSELEFLSNSNLWMNKASGLLPFHIYEGTDIKHLVKLPHQGIPLTGKKHPSYYQLSNRISYHKSVNYKDTDYWETVKPLNALVKIYSDTGNFELAYAAQLQELNKAKQHNQSPIFIMRSLMRTKYYAIRAGIPQVFLFKFVQTELESLRKNITLNGLDLLDSDPMLIHTSYQAEDIKIVYELMNDYLYPSDINNLPKVKNKNEFEKKLGKFLSLSDLQVEEICKSQDFRNLINSYSSSTENLKKYSRTLLLNVAFDEHISFELNRFVSVCLANYNKDTEYGELIKYLTESVENNAFIDLNFLPKIVQLAKYSGKENRIVGGAAALIASKYLFNQNMDSFVSNGSASIRYNQKYLEEIIAASAGLINEVNVTEDNKLILSSLSYDIAMLGTAFHLPILSLNTTKRIMENSFSILGRQPILEDEWINFQKKNLDKLSSASNILEYVDARSNFSNHNYSVVMDNYAFAHNLDNFLYTHEIQNKDRDFIRKNYKLVNLFYGSGKIALHILDDNNTFHKVSDNISHHAVSELIENFSTGDVSDELYNKACKLFEPLRSFINREWPETNTILIPSVNLLPIPSQIMFGAYCDKEGGGVVDVADFGIGMKLLTTKRTHQYSANFFGLGNPQIPVNKNIKINFGNLTLRGGTAQKEPVNLRMLAPLPLAANEIVDVSKIYENSEIFLNEKASIGTLLSEAEKRIAITNETTIITIATHGFTSNLGGDDVMPGLLSVDDGDLNLFQSNYVSSYNLDNSIVILSACDTASGFIEKPDLYYSGFVQSFGDAGAEMVQASLWPIFSDAAKKNTNMFLKNLSGNDTLSAAIATQILHSDPNSLPISYIFP